MKQIFFLACLSAQLTNRLHMKALELLNFSYIVVVSFIDGGNRSTRRKPTTSSKVL